MKKGEASVTHGYSRKGKVSVTYTTWTRIKDRCYNPKKQHFERYGGRGIKVCDRWLNSFENFLADMGERPSNKHSIERNNKDGNYCKDNCRWALKIEQANNTSTNRFIEWNGITKTLAQWAVITKIPYHAIKKRLNRGWNIDHALTLPPDPSKGYFKTKKIVPNNGNQETNQSPVIQPINLQQ